MNSATNTLAAARIISGERELCGPDLEERSRLTASVLAGAGVGESDTVALLARNDFCYFELAEAIRYLGATLTPINWHLSPPEISYILDDCGAAALVAHEDLLGPELLEFAGKLTVLTVDTPVEVLAAYGPVRARAAGAAGKLGNADALTRKPIPETPRPPAPALFYTSGTTGRPKAVERRPLDLATQTAISTRTAAAFGLDDPAPMVSVMPGPLYHSAPYAYAQTLVRRGGTLILQPRFDAEGLLSLIEEHRVTHLHMVPTMFKRLLSLPESSRKRYDSSSLRYVVHGAAPCPGEVKRAMIDWWGPVINEYYAMTELGIVTTCSARQWLQHPGSVGLPAPGVKVIICSENGKEVPSGERGDICVRHEATSSFSYRGAPEKTADARRNGFFLTGDVGYFSEDGFLYIADRKGDMVISGGVNIYPAEIEDALLSLDSVADAVAFGVPDDDYGEQLVALVVLIRPIDAEELRRDLRAKLAGFKIPRVFKFVESIPREDSGKVKKRQLRDAYLAKREKPDD